MKGIEGIIASLICLKEQYFHSLRPQGLSILQHECCSIDSKLDDKFIGYLDSLELANTTS